MSDNYSDDNDSLKLNEKFAKEHKICTVSETSLKFQQLVSIFEHEESETKFKPLSQKRLMTAATAVQAKEAVPADRADEADEVGAEDGAADASSTYGSGRSDRAPAEAVPSGGNSSTAAAAYTSTVSVTNRAGGGWIAGQPGRNLLFVIHPWCMLHKSGADRQSEFPPPGFLERLKAKLMALHRQSDEQQRHGPPATASAAGRRRRHTHQRIKCWFQYTATALGGGGVGGPTSMTTVRAAYPRNEPTAVVDFLSVWRQCANVAAACAATNRDGRQPQLQDASPTPAPFRAM